VIRRGLCLIQSETVPAILVSALCLVVYVLLERCSQNDELYLQPVENLPMPGGSSDTQGLSAMNDAVRESVTQMGQETR
jgi:hypothetical protein